MHYMLTIILLPKFSSSHFLIEYNSSSSRLAKKGSCVQNSLILCIYNLLFYSLDNWMIALPHIKSLAHNLFPFFRLLENNAPLLPCFQVALDYRDANIIFILLQVWWVLYLEALGIVSLSLKSNDFIGYVSELIILHQFSQAHGWSLYKFRFSFTSMKGFWIPS